ncbi:bpX6 domain-containing protein [Archangium sp.]|uniref:bpX6 domain-containing protein n=1 Tax=Archangium sp. TaxID=1872627 RepID=UPI00286BA87E|nr:bpX6 domain-containing protein [Archangium sp.]
MSLARRRGPRAHVHRGTVEVAALWFDPALLGEAEARRRVLSAWAPGLGVYTLAGGFLLRLPAPRRMACDEAPGLPLTLEDGLLVSAPLSPTERERLAPPVGTAVLVRAGKAEVYPLTVSQRVEVSAWLDVSSWQVVRVEGLGAPPPPVREPTPVAAPTRARFGLGAPAPEAEAMRARMEGRAVPTPVAQAPRPRLLDRLRAWWRGEPKRPGEATVDAGARPSFLARLLSSLFGTSDGAGSGTAPASNAPAPPPPPSGPGLFSRLSEWLARSTPLGSLLGRRKAEYVRKLFDLFEAGNLEEALRYAIPLDKGAPSEQARVALGLPGPREKLSIQPSQGGSGAIFGGGAEVYEALRERYRQAFQKLEREGRIEEAAFVLAELLHEEAEAVSFLERHGRLKLAAELAEGRNLAPGLVVRQWVLAKDVARAVDIARRTGAFADAVPRLERTHPAEARVLRLLWGEVLAQAGNYGRAVEVVWPIEDARRLTRAWLERGVEGGGVGGARLLARMGISFPECFDTVRARALVLLEQEDAEGAPAREAFAEALAQELSLVKKVTGTASALLRPAVRALLRDRAAGHLLMKDHELKHCVTLTGDTALKADLPSLPALPVRTGFLVDGQPASYVFDRAEAGTWPLFDAVPLPDGRVLVALGEAGARLLAPDGRCLAHFDVPAFSLVLSVHEDRALALAPRGALKRLSRLDLTRRRAEPWCDARIDTFAREYDGNLWFIAVEDTVLAVDVLASDLRALWRVPQVGGDVRAVAAGPAVLSFVTLRPEKGTERWVMEYERWSYSLPDLTLRSRERLSVELVEPVVPDLSLRADGDLAVLAGEGGPRWGRPHGGRLLPPPTLPEMDLGALVLGGVWMAALEHTSVGVGVRLLERGSGAVLARFLFEGEHPLAVRFVKEELMLFDKVGRLARVDLARGEVRRVVPR